MKNEQTWRDVLVAYAMALLLACGVLPLVGCAQATDTAVQSEASETQTADEQTTDEQSDTEETAAGEDESTEEAIEWPDECTDRHGDVTVYAVTELTGEQICALLEQQDYVWSERNQMWIKMDGSAAFVVNNAEGEPLSKDEIAQLGTGGTEASVSYRIVTSEYSSAKKTLNNLARKIMTCDDIEYLGTSSVAVVYGPSEQRCLVFVSKSNGVFTVSVYSEPALAEGLFNNESGQELGATVDEVFETLTARTPATE